MLPSLLANYESRFPAYRREISEEMAEGFYWLNVKPWRMPRPVGGVY
jgi:hypothetical protein